MEVRGSGGGFPSLVGLGVDLFFGGGGFGGAGGVGLVGFLPSVAEARGCRLGGGVFCRVMDPSVPSGSDRRGFFGVIAMEDNPAAGRTVFGKSFLFVVSIVQRISTDGFAVEESQEAGDGGGHGESVAEKDGVFKGFLLATLPLALSEARAIVTIIGGAYFSSKAVPCARPSHWRDNASR